jgi:hypothetical protein
VKKVQTKAYHHHNQIQNPPSSQNFQGPKPHNTTKSKSKVGSPVHHHNEKPFSPKKKNKKNYKFCDVAKLVIIIHRKYQAKIWLETRYESLKKNKKNQASFYIFGYLFGINKLIQLQKNPPKNDFIFQISHFIFWQGKKKKRKEK